MTKRDRSARLGKRHKRERERVAIVFDGMKWHIRRIRFVEHDFTFDEKVYRCDMPIANDLDSVNVASALYEVWLETGKC